MGKLKASLPDYPTIEYIYDEPAPIKYWAWASYLLTFKNLKDDVTDLD
jgi:hypothetical protein